VFLGIGCHGSHLVALEHHAIVLAPGSFETSEALTLGMRFATDKSTDTTPGARVGRPHNACVQHARARTSQVYLARPVTLSARQAFDARA
jgi:hypothetical protein